MKKSCAAILAALLCLLPCFAAGCSAPQEEEDAMTVLTSFAPIYALTLNVADGIDGVRVENMAASAAGCLHDYQLTTADMRKVESADVFVINGGGMESFLDKILRERAEMTVIDSSQGVELLDDDGDDGHGDEHAENPHIWLSIGNAMRQVENIRDGLCAADPAHAQQYRDNAAAFLEELRALDTEYAAGLQTLRTRDIVTFHEAFEYLARDYGLNVIAVVTAEPGAAPDPRTLQTLIDTVREKHTAAIFDEPQYDNATARLIAESTGAARYTLDPLVTGEITRDSYVRVMRENLAVLRQALA